MEGAVLLSLLLEILRLLNVKVVFMWSIYKCILTSTMDLDHLSCTDITNISLTVFYLDTEASVSRKSTPGIREYPLATRRTLYPTIFSFSFFLRSNTHFVGIIFVPASIFTTSRVLSFFRDSKSDFRASTHYSASCLGRSSF